MVNQYIKGKLTRVWTLGMFESIPYESSAIMTAFIIDLKNRNILYFKRNIWANRDPSEIVVIKSQLSDLINFYFM